MKNINFSFIACLLLITTLNAQNYEWTKSVGGPNTDIGKFINVDNSGNVYITGNFNGTIDFDPGVGITNLTSTGSSDIYVQKMNSSGNLLWAKSFGGIDYDDANSIITDALGNIYVIGSFYGTADFDPGVGTANHTSVGNSDIFVVKIDASGNFIWAKSFGGNSNIGDHFSIFLDVSGNIYTSGTFSGTGDFDPGTGTQNLTSIGFNNVFVQKLDASGNYLWARSFGENSNVHSINIDTLDNVYVSGEFQGTSDFNPGAGTDILTSLGEFDIFVQKMDTSGNFIWAKSFGGISFDTGASTKLDNLGNIYMTGRFYETVDFNPGVGTANLTSAGSSDIYVQKMDASGNLIWAKSFGGSSYDEGTAISIDPSGNIYTSGRFYGTIDFNPGTGITNLTSVGGWDIFVQKMDASGNFLWAKSFGGTSSNGEYIYSICANTSGDVYTTGYYHGTVDFDPGFGTDNLTSAGNGDIFVHKMSQTNLDTNDFVKNAEVIAYPNPTSKTVVISFGQVINNVELILSDIEGKVISKQTYSTISNTSIELKGESGFYFLTIKTSENQKVIKLIKE